MSIVLDPDPGEIPAFSRDFLKVVSVGFVIATRTRQTVAEGTRRQ
jgi:hypothetical protein